MTNNFAVTIIATTTDGLIDYTKNFATKREAWDYIKACKKHAVENDAVRTATAAVYDLNKRTRSIFHPYKRVYYTVLKK